MALRHRLRGLQPAELVLLLADLAINLGFFMLVPYLSIHVRENLGLSATIAGLVLAARQGTQQLLMVFAGPTADLYGYKWLLMAGLLVRALGFASFAFMSDLNGLLISALLSGLGGALFSSAERAAFAALSAGRDQAGRFAMLYTAQSIGATVGPLLGALLLNVDFRILSLAAGGVYLPIVVLVWLYLPNLTSGRKRPTGSRAIAEVVGSIAAVARNRQFTRYCLIAAGFWAISGQINISLALHAASVTGSPTSVKYLLLLSSLMVIAGQYRLSSWLEGRWPQRLQWAGGAGLSGLAFLVLIPFPGMYGLLACVALITLGTMLVRPNDYALVMGMAPRDSLASYYGFSALAVALGGSAGQFLGGRMIDLVEENPALGWSPWVTFAGVGLAAAAAMFRFGPRPQWQTRVQPHTL